MSNRMRVAVVGDTLLDVDVAGSVERICPDAPVPVVDEQSRTDRPGGAGLAALLAAREGADVTLVTAIGDDPAGGRVRELLAAAGVETVDLGLAGETPAKTRIRSDGQSLLRLDSGGGGRVRGDHVSTAAEQLAGSDGVLVADYGAGVARTPGLFDRAPVGHGPPLVWDPHPRGGPPPAGVLLATPNLAEAQRFAGAAPRPRDMAAVAGWGETLLEEWACANIAITAGSLGALLVRPAALPMHVPATSAGQVDACGAGDCFAAAATLALAGGALPSEAVTRAVASAAEFVAAGAAGALARADSPPRLDPSTLRAAGPEGIADAVRLAGGTVVAAGGCFDLLHSGHVATLRAARALGDCLVVCLNSDESVRRLKGPERPYLPERERAEILRALDCVDAVAVFDDDTPERLLKRIRPHLFVKGGDYIATELPEAEILAAWNGRVVVAPYSAGRSTTAIVEEVRRRAVQPG